MASGGYSFYSLESIGSIMPQLRTWFLKIMTFKRNMKTVRRYDIPTRSFVEVSAFEYLNISREEDITIDMIEKRVSPYIAVIRKKDHPWLAIDVLRVSWGNDEFYDETHIGQVIDELGVRPLMIDETWA